MTSNPGREKIVSTLKLLLVVFSFISFALVLLVSGYIWIRKTETDYEVKSSSHMGQGIVTICEEHGSYTPKFGRDEYFCYGSCSCYDEEDETMWRRSASSSSSFASKGVTMFVSAISGIVAYGLARTKVEEYCQKEISDTCSEPYSIVSEVDTCMYNSMSEDDQLADTSENSEDIVTAQDEEHLKHFPETLVYYQVEQLEDDNIGPIMVARFSTKNTICFMGFTDDLEDLRKHFSSKHFDLEFEETADDILLTDILYTIVTLWNSPRGELNEYLNKLDVDYSASTKFQKMVLEKLRSVPPGETVSYSELSNQVDVNCGARAVANVMKSNKVALICPCHRVIRKNGEMGEYGYGADKKEYLLKREGYEKSDDEEEKN